MLSTTRVPYVIDRLVEEFRGDPDFGDDVGVLDGPLLSGDFPTTSFIIGWTDEDHRGATSERTSPAGLRRNDTEQFEVVCALISINGDTVDESAKLARDRVVAALEVIEARLASNLNLGSGGSVLLTMGRQEWYQIPTVKGIECTCVFTLVGKALL